MEPTGLGETTLLRTTAVSEADGLVGLEGADGGVVVVGDVEDGAGRVGMEETGALTPGVVGIETGIGGTVGEGVRTTGGDGVLVPVGSGVDGAGTEFSVLGVATKSFSPQPRIAKSDRESKMYANSFMYNRPHFSISASQSKT